ncbi:MAG TPA: PQQ-dependent sugar dehydrogenase [Pirellulales bacterium]|nr:PQQ-dependent sugar dehydrogenase [Pirellulales bacterium]
MKQSILRAAIVIGVVWLACPATFVFVHRPAAFRFSANAAAAESPSHAAEPVSPRVAWTTSHVTGAPEPPPPYVTPRIFPKLAFTHPLEMVVAPGSDRWFVVEQGGEIFSFPNSQDCAKADLFLDIQKQSQMLPPSVVLGDTYGLAFDPKFAENHYCYVCYNVYGKPGNTQLPDGTRVSRFRVTGIDPPRVDPASEKIIITWLGGGHNGGSLKFGPDGFLYISSGDGGFPNPPDPHNTGQDISDLLSSILRIDVDHPSGNRPYTIPADNPFVDTPGARGEVWAYGLRNPWRMSFDRQTGELWAGDVGWELWESIDRIKKGGNYGWSIVEGPQPVYPDHKCGPTPILAPNLAFPHTDACCIIGGYVYRGKRLKELVGSYICGDWETRRMWGTRFDGDKPVSHRELVEGGPRIVAFGEAHDGELCILDYDLGTIHELQPNPERDTHAAFPTRLSQTGLFEPAETDRRGAPPSARGVFRRLAPGVVPFSIVAEQWADHATAERFIALPGLSSVEVHREPVDVPGSMFSQQEAFPKDGLLVKTFSMEMESGNPASRRRLETQLLHFNGRDWRGYSYRWNDAETDATLVAASGEDRKLAVADPHAPGGKRIQTWHYPSRNECLMCHNPWVRYQLAFTPPQLAAHDQLSRLEKMGIIRWAADPSEEFPDPDKLPPVELVNPYDRSADLDRRARSYLHVNCSHCHQFGAGGTADIELRANFPIASTKLLGAQPKQGSFGIKDAQIVAGGDPYRSVLFYRTSKMGHGRMPHIGSELVDVAGIELLRDWIRQLPVRPDDTFAIEQLRKLDESTALARERQNRPRDLALRSRDIAKQNDRDNPSESDRKLAAEQLDREAKVQVVARAKRRVEMIQRLLSSTSSALLLSHEIDVRPLPPALREQMVSMAYANGDPQIRDLFERFVPAEKRVARLGSMIDSSRLLAVAGDAERGRALFFSNSGVQCKNCHRIGDQGGKIGPELTHIGKKYSRAQLLAKLLEPSKTILPEYIPYLARTSDGKSHVGILVAKTDREVVLHDVDDKLVRIPAADVEQLIKQTRSLMPDQLLRDLSAEQAADLLSFLESLK